GTLRLVVSNPPYIAADELESLPDAVTRWEPHRALVSGPTGLEALDAITAAAPEWLAPRGVLVLELAPHQAAAMQERARVAGFREVAIVADLAGRDRVLVARRAG